ncbi:MAG TPA: hypothetical protein VM163_07790 [bacterium]|nr:hypothetical protein [bacterium]
MKPNMSFKDLKRRLIERRQVRELQEAAAAGSGILDRFIDRSKTQAITLGDTDGKSLRDFFQQRPRPWRWHGSI